MRATCLVVLVVRTGRTGTLIRTRHDPIRFLCRNGVVVFNSVCSTTISSSVEKGSMERNNNDENIWEGNIYIYMGGIINEMDKHKIEHVKIHELVAMIHDGAFASCKKLQTIQFSRRHNVLKRIGNGSFRECHHLSTIMNLQNTQVETIGDYAFFQCLELATVQFPSSVRRIGQSCFHYCTQLKILDLSHVKSLEAIEECAFGNCSNLTSVTLSPTTSRIGKRSFYWCQALEVVALRATCIDEIEKGTFDGCRNLTTIHFPTTTRRIGQASFRGCGRLASLDLHATSVKRIEEYAFQDCYNLTTVNFPKTLKYIGNDSFVNCTRNLEYLNLHKTSIEEIGNNAFFSCTNLATVVGISTNRQQDDDEEFQERMDDDETFRHSHMKLPASLVNIGWDPFHECPKLRNSIDNNWIHFECDVNRGGRKFLQRHHHRHQDNDGNDDDDDDGSAKKYGGKVHYYISLWPLILHRVMNNMKLPQHSICRNDDNLFLYTKANPSQRRASVVFYLLIYGVIADLQPSGSGNVQNGRSGHEDESTVTSLRSENEKRKRKKR